MIKQTVPPNKDNQLSDQTATKSKQDLDKIEKSGTTSTTVVAEKAD